MKVISTKCNTQEKVQYPNYIKKGTVWKHEPTVQVNTINMISLAKTCLTHHYNVFILIRPNSSLQAFIRVCKILIYYDTMVHYESTTSTSDSQMF